MNETKEINNQEAIEDQVEKNLEEAGVVPALDGGFGWVVVLASFLVNVVVDGIIFTVGDILLPIWVKEFRCSNASAALVISILSGSYLLVGPLASALTNMIGCRSVVIAGALLSSLGFITSAIATEIYFLYISFGLIGGVGFGLMYLPSIVIISQYFSIKRSMATGIAVAGSGIGTTIFSIANPFVMDVLGDNWRFFVVFLAFVSFTVILNSFAFKPVKPSEEQVQKVAEIVEDYEKTRKQSGTLTVVPQTLGSSLPHLNAARPFLSTIELNNMQKNLTVTNGYSQKNLQEVARDSVRDINRPLSKMDVFYTGSSNSLAARSRSNTMSKLNRPEPGSVQDMYQSNVLLSKIDLPSETAGSDIPIGWKHTLLSTFRGLLDPSLLYSPSFIILSLSGMLTLSCFYVPYNYLGDHINKLPDVSQTKKSLPISLLGIINILARIACGWIADQPQVDALMVTNVAVVGAGIATALVPFFGAYWHFIAFCLPFAVGAACFAALRSVIIVDLYGLEKLTNAFGILLTFMGIGATFGSPLTAYVKDITGNFDVSFYIMGTLMAISGLICVPLRSLREWEIRRCNPSDALNNVELEKLNQA